VLSCVALLECARFEAIGIPARGFHLITRAPTGTQPLASAIDQRDATQRAVLAALRWLVSTTRLMSKVKWKRTFFTVV